MSAAARPAVDSRLLTTVAVALATLLMLVLTVTPVDNNDVWILMKVGELIAETHRIPETVLFAFTTVRDNHFNAHEWLVSVVYHELDRAFGLARLMWVVGALACLQFALCTLLARRRSNSLGVGLLMAMLAMICANDRFVLRPELFALMFLVWLLLVLDRYRTGRRWTTLLWTVPVMILWANSHGSFLLAPGIVGLFAFGEALTAVIAASGTMSERLRIGVRSGLPYAVAALAMVLCCAINPAGWSLLAFPFKLQQSGVVRQLITEWLPTFSPQFMVQRAFWLFVLVGLCTAALVVALRRHLGITDALLLLVFTALALERSRHIVWFGFVALFVCAGLVGRVKIERRREMQWRAASAAFALLATSLCVVFGNAVHARIYESRSNNFSPVLVKELADPAMSGNVMNSYELGGELIYRDWPRLKPSLDSRVDSYGDDYLLFSIQLLQDEKLLDLFLEGNRVSFMLLLRRDFELGIRGMPSIRANWHIRLTDGDVFLLERNVPLPPEPRSALAH